jgi:hypothetical protein
MPNDPQARRLLAKRAQMARYVVSVDHQPKSSFDTREAADKEASRILQAFPILAVQVTDAEEDTVKVLGATHEPDEPDEPGATIEPHIP